MPLQIKFAPQTSARTMKRKIRNTSAREVVRVAQFAVCTFTARILTDNNNNKNNKIPFRHFEGSYAPQSFVPLQAWMQEQFKRSLNGSKQPVRGGIIIIKNPCQHSCNRNNKFYYTVFYTQSSLNVFMEHYCCAVAYPGNVSGGGGGFNKFS
jgi:hypothetical protein